jgi:hypothetical protein
MFGKLSWIAMMSIVLATALQLVTLDSYLGYPNAHDQLVNDPGSIAPSVLVFLMIAGVLAFFEGNWVLMIGLAFIAAFAIPAHHIVFGLERDTKLQIGASVGLFLLGAVAPAFKNWRDRMSAVVALRSPTVRDL